MRSILLAVSLALGLPAYASAPNDKATSHYVYVGKAGDDGKIDNPNFTGLPTLKMNLEATTDTKPDKDVTITCRQGVTIRADHSKAAATLGRLPIGEKVKLLGLWVSYGYVWAEINTDGAKVLAFFMGKPIDTFARPGTDPSAIIIWKQRPDSLAYIMRKHAKPKGSPTTAPGSDAPINPNPKGIYEITAAHRLRC